MLISHLYVVFREVSILFFFFFLASPYGLWDPSSLTRDQTQALAVRARSPNHWTAREFPSFFFFLEVSIARVVRRVPMYLHTASPWAVFLAFLENYHPLFRHFFP